MTPLPLPTTSRTALFALTIGAVLSVFPGSLQAQAGSKPAVLFDSVSSFRHSLADSGQALHGENEALVPEGIWLLPSDTRYLLWVELGQGRLNVLEQLSGGDLVLRRRIPVSIGKQGIGKSREGDQKTPVGTYRITSVLADSALDDFYGPGAFPLNYPNALDRRLARTGHGIWLHGLPKGVGERPFLDSDGCVVIDNDSLRQLELLVAAGSTLVVLDSDEIRWVPVASQQRQRDALEQALAGWKDAWERLDDADYEAWYAEDFSDAVRQRPAWVEYKRRVNAAKSWVRLELSQLSMIVDPQQQDLVTVRYYQRYTSSNHDWQGWKEQIWRHGGAGWQIIYEGNG